MLVINVGLDGAINGSWDPSPQHRMTILENIKTMYFYGRHFRHTKLNNTEAKLTGVSPHCFVIVIVKPWASLFVIALDIIHVFG